MIHINLRTLWSQGGTGVNVTSSLVKIAWVRGRGL